MAKWEPKAHEREVRKERKISIGTFMLGSMLAASQVFSTASDEHVEPERDSLY